MCRKDCTLPFLPPLGGDSSDLRLSRQYDFVPRDPGNPVELLLLPQVPRIVRDDQS